MKKILTLFLLALLAVVALPQAKADTTGDVTGTFTSTGYNNDAIIDYPNLEINRVTFSGSESAIVTTALTPQLNYYAEFDVDDLDGFSDLVVEFQFYYHTAGEGTTVQEDFEANSSTEIDGVIIKWDATNGFVQDMNSTTWVFNPTKDDLSGNYVSAASAGETSKTFKIYFSPSKVAPASSTGEWVAGIKVYDYIGVTDWVHGVDTPTDTYFENVTSYTMDWYGEVQHGADTIAWNSALAGMDYGDAGSEQTYNGMTFVSNSDYHQEVKAAETWTQSGGVVALDATLKASPTTVNSFGLRAVTIGEWFNELDIQQPALSESTATQITHVDFVTIGGVYYQRTGEAGATGSILLQLKLAPDFQNGTYTGTITFGITNVVAV
jgi:hypothetical protein